jgi:hypothetical protein
MNPDEEDREETQDSPPLSTPYGPHPGHIDDASGGADSSPFENLSSEERVERLRTGPTPGEDTSSAPAPPYD